MWIEDPLKAVLAGTASIFIAVCAIIAGMSTIGAML
jgi:hypothetical protein